MPKRRRKNPPKGRTSDVAPETTKGGPAQYPPYPERSPGEHRYKDINHKARIARIARTLKFAKPPTPLSPTWQELMAYLKPFWGSPHEAEIWDLYKRFTRVDSKYQSDIEGAAAGEGLAAQDWIAKSALDEIRRHVRLRPPLLAILTDAAAEAVQREAVAKMKADTPDWITKAADKAAEKLREAKGQTVKIPALACLCKGRGKQNHMAPSTFTKNVVPVLLDQGFRSKPGAAGGLFDPSARTS